MEKTKAPAEDPTRAKLIATYSEETPEGDIFYKGFAEIKLDKVELISRPMADACGILAQSFNRVAPAEFRGPEPNTKDTFIVDYEDESLTRLVETGIELFSQLLGYAAAEIEKPEYAGLKAADFFTGGLYKKILGAAWDAMQQGTKPETELDPESKKILDSIARGQARTIYRANNVATNDLLGDLIYTDKARGGLTHPTFTKNNKKANTIVRVSMKDRGNITTSRPVSEFDDAVSTAVNSLIIDRLEAGHVVAAATSDQICRQLKGDLDGGRVGEEERAAVQDTIQRLTNKDFLTVHIDATEELRLRGVIGPNDVWKESGPPLVLVSEGVGIVGGHEVTRYVFAPSVLVLYSQMNGHETRLPVKALEIHDVDKNGNLLEKKLVTNSTRIQIINYLERRVAIMYSDEKNARALLRKYNSDRRKNQKKPPEERENLPEKTVKDFRYMEKNRTILFDTMFRDLGITDHTERAKEFIRKVLDNWKVNKIMQLKGYTLRKKAKSRADAITEIEFWSR